MGKTRRAGWWAVVPALALQACATAPQGVAPDPVTYAPAARPIPIRLAVEEDEQRFVRHDRPEWGLALSGGGLRSAMFALGVTKALYDAGTTDKVEIVSTVSGGGYTALWLYTRHLAGKDGNGRFASGSLADDRFDDQLCHFMGQGNFVTYPQVLPLLLARFRAPWGYEQALARTFGAAGNPAMADLADRLEPARAPFLIQNASVVAPLRPWHTRLLEMTPVAYGNAQHRTPWATSGAAERLSMITTTAMSGAAVSALDRRVDLADPGSVPPGHPSLTATDGGKTENLGAFALIRRGVRNVIIADAEHDPRYGFEAYRTLRAGLAAHGLTLRVPAIEDHLRLRTTAPFGHWEATGTVTDATGQTVSTLYYVKASLTPDALARLRDPAGPYTQGEAETERLRVAIDHYRATGQDTCEGLTIGQPLDLQAWSTYTVGSYAHFLRRLNKARLMRLLGITKTVIDFPQYSTLDQSFYTDQTSAFIGLGYLQGSTLTARLRDQSAQ